MNSYREELNQRIEDAMFSAASDAVILHQITNGNELKQEDFEAIVNRVQTHVSGYIVQLAADETTKFSLAQTAEWRNDA